MGYDDTDHTGHLAMHFAPSARDKYFSGKINDMPTCRCLLNTAFDNVVWLFSNVNGMALWFHFSQRGDNFTKILYNMDIPNTLLLLLLT